MASIKLGTEWSKLNARSVLGMFMEEVFFGRIPDDIDNIEVSFYDEDGKPHHGVQRVRITRNGFTEVVPAMKKVEDMRTIIDSIDWSSRDRPVGSFDSLGDW
jgi:hypothetical protein